MADAGEKSDKVVKLKKRISNELNEIDKDIKGMEKSKKDSVEKIEIKKVELKKYKSTQEICDEHYATLQEIEQASKLIELRKSSITTLDTTIANLDLQISKIQSEHDKAVAELEKKRRRLNDYLKYYEDLNDKLEKLIELLGEEERKHCIELNILKTERAKTLARTDLSDEAVNKVLKDLDDKMVDLNKEHGKLIDSISQKLSEITIDASGVEELLSPEKKKVAAKKKGKEAVAGAGAKAKVGEAGAGEAGAEEAGEDEETTEDGVGEEASVIIDEVTGLPVPGKAPGKAAAAKVAGAAPGTAPVKAPGKPADKAVDKTTGKPTRVESAGDAAADAAAVSEVMEEEPEIDYIDGEVVDEEKKAAREKRIKERKEKREKDKKDKEKEEREELAKKKARLKSVEGGEPPAEGAEGAEEGAEGVAEEEEIKAEGRPKVEKPKKEEKKLKDKLDFKTKFSLSMPQQQFQPKGKYVRPMGREDAEYPSEYPSEDLDKEDRTDVEYDSDYRPLDMEDWKATVSKAKKKAKKKAPELPTKKTKKKKGKKKRTGDDEDIGEEEEEDESLDEELLDWFASKEKDIRQDLLRQGLQITPSNRIITKDDRVITLKQAQRLGLLHDFFDEDVEEEEEELGSSVDEFGMPVAKKKKGRDKEVKYYKSPASSASTLGKESSESHICGRDMEYLKVVFGKSLTIALAEITAIQPTDPIHYLAHWMLKYRYNQEIDQITRIQIQELMIEQERLAAEKWHRELQEEARLAVLEALFRAENIIIQRDFQSELQLREYEGEFEESSATPAKL